MNYSTFENHDKIYLRQLPKRMILELNFSYVVGLKYIHSNYITAVFFPLIESHIPLSSLQKDLSVLSVSFSSTPAYPAWYKNGPAATCGLTILRLNAVYVIFVSVSAINMVPLIAGSPS